MGRSLEEAQGRIELHFGVSSVENRDGPLDMGVREKEAIEYSGNYRSLSCRASPTLQNRDFEVILFRFQGYENIQMT